MNKDSIKLIASAAYGRDFQVGAFYRILGAFVANLNLGIVNLGEQSFTFLASPLLFQR